jgi:hypothetical protein
MALTNATITLLEPIQGPGPNKDQPTVEITQIVLRPPKFLDVQMLGEPAAFARSEGGLVFTSEKDDVIHGYIERLMIEPKDKALLGQVGLADTLQLREAIFDFFKAARLAI